MDGNLPVFDARHLQVIPKEDLMKLLIKFTYDVYIKKLPKESIPFWTPNQCHSMMEHFIDIMLLGQPVLPPNINSITIQLAIDNNWTVPELVWTAIALQTNTMPMMCASCQRAVDNAENDEYTWGPPISNNRQIHQVTDIVFETTGNWQPIWARPPTSPTPRSNRRD